MLFEEAHQKVDAELCYDVEAKCACHSILSFLEENPIETLKHIHFLTLKNKINTNNNSLVFKAANYLSGDSLKILKVGFEYIEEDNYEEITPEEYTEIESTKKYYYDGKPVLNYENKIFIYFSLNTASEIKK